MKKLLAFIFCMTIIPALILALVVGYFYENYYKPTPVDYEFLRGENEICSVEYAHVSFDGDGNLRTERVDFISDTDSFIKDIKSLDCYEGIPLDSIQTLTEIESISGFVINYNDGSFEVITPYVCLNSDLQINELEDLLDADVYVFDKNGIQEMIRKYAPSGMTPT